MIKRLIQIGWVVLTLTSLWVFSYGLFWLTEYAQQPPAWLIQSLAEAGVSSFIFFALNATVIVIVYVCFFTVAQLIVLRRAHEPFALFVAIVLLCFGTANALPLLPEFQHFVTGHPPLFSIAYYLVDILAWCLGTVFVVTYPDGRFVPRWTLGVSVFSFILAFTWTTNPEIFNRVQGIWLVLLVSSQVFIAGAVLYAQVWRYRHYYSPIQKQQVKWFVYGLTLASIAVIAYPLLNDLLATEQIVPIQIIWFDLLFLFVWVSIVVLPVSIGIAISRYRLWDIDIVIRRTLVYSTLTVILAIVYFGIVALSQQLFASVIGQRSEIVIIVSTLAIAALFNPLRKRIQDFLDRRFYRKKYDAQQVLARFAKTARDETDIDKLTSALMHVADETMQPESVSVWLKKTDDRSARQRIER